MKNIFLDYPDFISSDRRTMRGTTPNGGYRVDSKLQYLRHSISVSPDSIKDCSVLDLGCCVGATGAWALHHGAKSYVGVEIDSDFCQHAVDNFTKYFPNGQWTIKNQSLEVFLNENKDKFDVVIAFGVLHGSINTESILQNISQLAEQTIIIDSIVPPHIVDLNKKQVDTETLALLEIVDFSAMGRSIKSGMPSLPFLSVMLGRYGFELENDFTNLYDQALKNIYIDRYCASFKKSNDLITSQTFENHYNTQEIPTPIWKFDTTIAKEFVDHARHHIPGYDKIIQKTINICRTLLPFDNHHKIIDVGCATGQTLKQLSQAGFYNLVGVDSSASMLDHARSNGVDQIAYLVDQNNFPVDIGPYAVVICNWTLHFIQDKTTYLADVFNSLQPGGLIIITDKTYNSGMALDLYHDFKRTQGVSEQEIVTKHLSVQDIMFIEPPEWYLATLKSIGFADASIIDADFCFTTFLAKKSNQI